MWLIFYCEPYFRYSHFNLRYFVLLIFPRKDGFKSVEEAVGIDHIKPIWPLRCKNGSFHFFFSKECKCHLLFNLQKWKAHNIGPFLNSSINFISNSMIQSDQVIFEVKLVWPSLTYNCHLNTQHSDKQATMLTTALTLSVIYKTFVNLYNHGVQWHCLIWWVRSLSGIFEKSI